MKTSDIIKILLIVGAAWIGWKFAEPYWDKYWFVKEVEKAATFGIKRGEDQTRRLITDAFAEIGVKKTGQDCYVFLDERKVMNVRCEYDAKVEIFGKLLHTYRMKVEVAKREEVSKYL